MLQKAKLGFWIVSPVVIGVFVASLLFPDGNQKIIAEEIGKTPEIIIQQPEKIPEPDFLKFIFVGDIMLDRGVRASVVKNMDGDYSKIFENLDLLKNADITFGNLEGTASDKGADVGSKFSFHMDPAVVDAIKNAGIDIVSVANNHVGDWGIKSYVDSLSRLKTAGILYTGGEINKSLAIEPTIIEKNGMKIGFLGFSDVGPRWMEVTAKTPGLLLATDPNFDEIIKNAKEKVDYLVVSFHWGIEYKDLHNARQEELAHRAVDDGAKLVIGHHPHVVEDTEIYSRKDCTQSSCMSFIAYSLGNFIFDQSFSTATMQGLLLNVKLNKDGSMTVRKDISKLNKFFQPSEIIPGQEEEIKFIPTP